MTDRGRQLRSAAERLRRHHTGRILAAVALRGGGIALLLLAALLVFDALAPGVGDPNAFVPLLVRTLGFLAVVMIPVGLLGLALARRAPAMRDLEEAARRTERESTDLRERLLPALQLLRIRDDGRTAYSAELVDAFVDDTADRATAAHPESLPYNGDVGRAARWAVAGAVATAACVAVLGVADAGRGVARLAGAMGHLGPQPPAVFAVDPGNLSVPRGTPLELAARVDYARFGRDGAHGELQWKDAREEEWNSVPLAGRDVTATSTDGDRVPSARFAHAFAEVRRSFTYRFVHAGEASETFAVEAVPRPSLGIESVRYRYPEYTALPDRVVQDGSGDLAALRGSVAEILLRCTNEPKSGAIERGDGTVIPLEAGEDRTLRAEIAIDEEGTYRLRVEDLLGMTNPNPLEYRIRALPDEAPFIRLLEPGEDRDLDDSMRVDLRYSAIDDFGLGPVRLVWEISRREGDAETREVWTPDGARTEASGTFAWDLGELDLLPGDTVAYHLEVTDNNVIDGPRTARTREYMLRFPTMSEMFAEIDRREESSIEELRETVEEARKVEERVQEISREMLKQGESSWENRQEMERALERQQQLAEDLEQTRQEIESNLEELAQSEFATLEAIQKMEQIRKLLDEVTTNEMKEALEKLRRAMEETNPRRQQEELADFQESQQEMLEQLDRIMKNLEQFRLEEKMRAAVRSLEELAARQEQVNDKLAAVTPDEEKDRPDERSGDEEAADPKDSSPDETDVGDEAAESRDGDEQDADAQDGEPQDGEPQDGESQEGESQDGESQDGESQDGEQQDGEQQDGEQQDGAESEPQDEGETESEREMKNLAREEEALAEEARRMEQELKELAEMTQQLRDAQDGQNMQELSEQMDSAQLPEQMDGMAEDMQDGSQGEAQEKGEEALTQLREMLTGLQAQQQGMAQKMMQISQAAINRAVRDLLSLSTDEEDLSGNLAQIPRNSASATRSFADEQYLLIQGAERVEQMLREVAEGTPLMDSSIGRQLDDGLDAMKDAAFGLENGAVTMAQDDSEKVVDSLNAVVIALLKTSQSMSSCASGMPMSSFMQQLQELSGDQQKLNEALQKLMQEGGMSMDRRLQGQMDSLAQEQRRIQEQLEQLLEEMGSGQGTLGRLDDVEKKLDETAERLEAGDVDDQLLEDQAWALTRLLDSQRSMREREMGRERQSRTGEELSDLVDPQRLPEGLEDLDRDLREDLLKALDRRYPPKYEELIRRYFRSLSDESPAPDLP